MNSHFVWITENNLKEIPKGYVIHHKDGDSLNDNIENLEILTDSEHKKLQARDYNAKKKKGKDLIWKIKIKKNTTSLWTNSLESLKDISGDVWLDAITNITNLRTRRLKMENKDAREKFKDAREKLLMIMYLGLGAGVSILMILLIAMLVGAI